MAGSGTQKAVIGFYIGRELVGESESSVQNAGRQARNFVKDGNKGSLYLRYKVYGDTVYMRGNRRAVIHYSENAS